MIRRMLRFAPLLGLLLASSGAVGAPPRRMFPAFVMFRGGGLARPVLLGHSNLKTVTLFGKEVADLSADPLAILYQTLTVSSRVPPDVPDVVAEVEVAEFFGPVWSAVAGSDGKPTRTLEFGEANHFSRIYLLRDGPPIWKDPAVAPGGDTRSLLVLSDTAQAILRGLGLQVR